jgi:mannose-6-phosphate isomerase
MKIEPQPYKLFNHIQNYEWGTKGKDAFIPSLLGFDGEEKPYAELWIGDHPKLSSVILIEGHSYTLNDIVESQK